MTASPARASQPGPEPPGPAERLLSQLDSSITGLGRLGAAAVIREAAPQDAVGNIREILGELTSGIRALSGLTEDIADVIRDRDDLERAERLLRDGHWPGGCPVSLSWRQTLQRQREILRRELARLDAAASPDDPSAEEPGP